MKIEGTFSSENLFGYKQFLAFPKLGERYMPAEKFVKGIGELWLYIKEVPSFETVYNKFMNQIIPCLGINKQQDICLSLFYDPYFDDFYKKVEQFYTEIANNRKRFLIKNFLNFLADETTFKIFLEVDSKDKENYFQKDMFNKSKQLLNLLSKRFQIHSK